MNVKIVIALAMEYLSPFVSFAFFCFCFIFFFTVTDSTLSAKAKQLK